VIRSLLAVLSGWLAAPLPQAQVPPAASAPSQSSAAAIGFLESRVDARIYSLDAAGAARISGTMKATFETIARDPQLKGTSFDLSLVCDLRTGQGGVAPIAPPDEMQKQVLPFVVAAAQNAFSFRPSRAARQWVVDFVQDGDLIRLDYKPAQSADDASSGGFSEWHAADGKPVRRKVTSFRPVGAATEKLVQEIVPTFVEKDGRLLLTELRPGDPNGRFSWTFTYEQKDGFHVLKKLAQENEAWRLTLDFTLTAEKAAAPR
jgi:hypothetical protein